MNNAETLSNERGIIGLREAAERLGITAAAVRRLVHSGQLPVVSYTKHRNEKLKFRAIDIARLIAANLQHKAPAAAVRKEASE